MPFSCTHPRLATCGSATYSIIRHGSDAKGTGTTIGTTTGQWADTARVCRRYLCAGLHLGGDPGDLGGRHPELLEEHVELY